MPDYDKRSSDNLLDKRVYLEMVEEISLIESLLSDTFNRLRSVPGGGRERALSIDKLQESLMWLSMEGAHMEASLDRMRAKEQKRHHGTNVRG